MYNSLLDSSWRLEKRVNVSNPRIYNIKSYKQLKIPKKGVYVFGNYPKTIGAGGIKKKILKEEEIS